MDNNLYYRSFLRYRSALIIYFELKFTRNKSFRILLHLGLVLWRNVNDSGALCSDTITLLLLLGPEGGNKIKRAPPSCTTRTLYIHLHLYLMKAFLLGIFSFIPSFLSRFWFELLTFFYHWHVYFLFKIFQYLYRYICTDTLFIVELNQ